ncbi:hypothetical protein [Actinocatenispora rupis]|nr:hypothetical protein [Actinocatenispora rupis]
MADPDRTDDRDTTDALDPDDAELAAELDLPEHGQAYKLGYLVARLLPRVLFPVGAVFAVIGLFHQSWSIFVMCGIVAVAIVLHGIAEIMDYEVLRGLPTGTRTLVVGIVSLAIGAALGITTIVFALTH